MCASPSRARVDSVEPHARAPPQRGLGAGGASPVASLPTPCLRCEARGRRVVTQSQPAGPMTSPVTATLTYPHPYPPCISRVLLHARTREVETDANGVVVMLAAL